MREVLLSVLVLASCSFSFGQEKDIIWKRRISRVIEVSLKGEEQNQLAIRIAMALKSGKITAYVREDDGSLRKMDPTELPNAFVPPNDTVVVNDRAHDKTIYKIMRRELKPDSLHHFITLEDWSYSPAGDTINSCITHLAVAYDVHDANGRSNGERAALFWIRYEDIVTFMHDDATGQLKKVLGDCICRNYFKDDKKTRGPDNGVDTRTGIWHGHSIPVIDMGTAGDTTKKYYTDEQNDSLLSEMMVADVRDNKVPAWMNGDDTAAKEKLTDQEILTQTTTTDTLYDPANKACMGVIRTELNYKNVNTYMLWEGWSFNPETGKTTVCINRVALLQRVYNEHHEYWGERTIFYLNYNDIQPMLKRIEERHPDNTLKMRIWNVLFK